MDTLWLFDSSSNEQRILLKGEFSSNHQFSWKENQVIQIRDCDDRIPFPCIYTFYSLRLDSLSKQVATVLAYDTVRDIAAIKHSRLIFVKVFALNKNYGYDDSNSMDFSEDSRTGMVRKHIRNAKFDDKGNFIFEYKNTDGNWVIDKISAEDIKL